MKKGLIVLAVIALVGAGIFIMAGGNDNPAQQQNETTNNQVQDTETEPEDEQPVSGNTLTYDGNNFTPSQITVMSGESVTIVNNSSRSVQFSSDDHPAHTDNPELNTDVLAPGESTTFTVNRKGTFGYHDHLNPNVTGTIVVE